MKTRARHSKRKQCFERDRYRCTRCGAAQNLTVDHVVPTSLGGSKGSIANMQTLCCDCNIAKDARS